ncbi:hypothetical protein HanOQP8_Chr01g0009911 [Helianthus annuus]|nr:hypothetical protein HanOQP8_Chr01g0009911 [Helianthus annuus]
MSIAYFFNYFYYGQSHIKVFLIRYWQLFCFQHFLGHYHFKSKTLQDEFSPEGRCRASMFALFVKEELESWPEQSRRVRSWVTIPEAVQCCRHSWMREALETGFNKWNDDGMVRTMKAATNNQLDACDGDKNTI